MPERHLLRFWPFLILAFVFSSGSVLAQEARLPGAVAVSKTDAAPLDFVEVVTGGANPQSPLPMVVAIHGLGSSPERFSSLIRNFEFPARFVLPRAPEPWGRGSSWFPSPARNNISDPGWIKKLEGSADRIASLIKALSKEKPTVGRAMVLGFSQGGILSFIVAVRHPELVGVSVPIAGFLPEIMVPAKTGNSLYPAVYALHGEADSVIPFKLALRSVSKLKTLGVKVKLSSFPGVKHRIPTPLREELYRRLKNHVEAPFGETGVQGQPKK